MMNPILTSLCATIINYLLKYGNKVEKNAKTEILLICSKINSLCDLNVYNQLSKDNFHKPFEVA